MNKEVCWNITAKCNQSCKYCHRFLDVTDLSYEDNLFILNNLINSGIDSITWTGGEALLLNRLDDLLKYSYERGIKNKLITNGKLLTHNRIDKIYKYLDSFTLSIDSTDDDINVFLGRGKSHFVEIKEILDYIDLKKYNVKIRINSVVCKQTLNSFDKLIDFLNDYNIYSWRIFKFMPLREKAIVNKQIFDISMEEYSNMIEKLKEKSNIKRIDTRVEEDMEKKYILILANGDIVITNKGKDEKVGNALTDLLAEYL